MEDDVMGFVAEAIGVPVHRVTINSISSDFAEWDSMGTLAIMTILDRHGMNLEPGEMEQLQSVQGVLAAVRKFGKLA